MKRRALLIGVNQYHLLGRLSYARQDAEAVAKVLCQYGSFSDTDITLMTCQTEGACLGLSRYIEHALMDLREERGIDLLVFGFWGHGFAPVAGRRYLCGMDTVESDLERTAVSFDAVKAKLAQVGAVNTVVLLDCCQNHPAGRSVQAEPMTAGEEMALASMARDIQVAQRTECGVDRIPTVAILNACREGQKAYEWKEREHGVFTAHFLDGLCSGRTTIAQLASFVCDRTPPTVRQIHREQQIPWFTIEGRGDIELSVGQGSGVEVTPVPPVARVKCPLCGMRNDPDETFECRGCKRDYLCLDHFVRDQRCCEECVEKLVSEENAARARAERERKAEEARRSAQAFFPMTIEQARKVQRTAAEAWGVPLVKSVELGGGVNLEMIFIPPGEFMMGSPAEEEDRDDDENLHQVRLTKGFYLGRYPVTQAQYKAVMGKNRSHFKGKDRPVEEVSWRDAAAFCEQLSHRVGQRVMLPTEAQWEYACRAGTTTPFSFGATISTNQANYDGNHTYGGGSKGVYREETTRVGQFSSNAWGLYDMHGNVDEWCSDWYLLARDSLQAFPEYGSLSLELLRKTFEHLCARKRILLLDACRNNPSAGRADADNCMGDVISRDIVAAARSRPAAGTTTALLSACRSGQRAYEWPAKGHGVFTYCLIEGLDGAAWRGGELEFNRLAGYAAKEVRQWAANMPGLPMPQEPWYEQFGDPDSIFLAEGSCPPGSMPAGSKPEPPRMAHREAPGVRVKCPLCGIRNAVDLTFECRVCRRDYICRDHFVKERRCCEECGEKLVSEENSARAKADAERKAKVLQAQAAEQERAAEALRAENRRRSQAIFPMSAEQSQAVQRSAAEAFGVPLTKELNCGGGVSLPLVLIPAGRFLMGSPENDVDRFDDEGPQHEVTISGPFYLGQFPVTQAQYEAVMGKNPSHFTGNDRPVECVCWDEAVVFCAQLSRKVGHWVTLPTEAQWEYACRAGTAAGWYGDVDAIAWHDGNSGGETHPVGRKRPNAWGLYDMLGNVWEWCADNWHEDYTGAPTDGIAWQGTDPSRVVRGGSWRSSPWYCRSASRNEGTPDHRYYFLGFRVVYSFED